MPNEHPLERNECSMHSTQCFLVVKCLYRLGFNMFVSHLIKQGVKNYSFMPINYLPLMKIYFPIITQTGYHSAFESFLRLEFNVLGKI